MNRLDSASVHRAERGRTRVPYKLLFLLFVFALLLLATATPAATAACPPPSVARPRVQTTGEDVNGGDLVPGDEILWTITAKNIGGTTLTEVVATDLIPEWTSYVAGSIEGFGADDSEPSTLKWAVGTLKSGERETLSFRSRVDENVPEGTYITNQASTDSAQTPPGVSEVVKIRVVGSSVVLSASPPTTVLEGATGDNYSAQAPGTSGPAGAEVLDPSKGSAASSASTPALEGTAGDAPSPVAAAAGDDRSGYRLGLGLGLGLGGLAAVGLAAWLLMWRRRRASA